MRARLAVRRVPSVQLESLEERRLLTAVAGHYIFYNDSTFDGGDPAADAADDAAIAPDKSPFLSDVLFSVDQLTTNTDFDSEPRVYGDKIVWQGRGGTDAGSDDEIFYFDGTTVIQLTQNSVPDRFPEISALGISWERGSGTGQEIIFWNGGETPLTSNAVFDGNASLSDNRLSWEQGSGNALEIWSWDGVNPPANISNNAVVDVQPYANGNNTVWVNDSVPNRKVLFYNGVTTPIIGTSNFSIEDPRADGLDVAWEGFKAGTTNDREIYYYNGTIVQRLTTNSFGDFDPQVSDGHVTWWGGVFNDFQVSLYDGNTVREISTGIRNQFPQIDGQYVVWQGYDGNDNEIFLWDGVKVTQLTNNGLDDTSPRISGKHIVWQGLVASTGTTQEIFHTYIDQEQAEFQNVTSYSRGINGIMVDLADLPPGTVLTADDFKFKIGNNNAPNTWIDAPPPTTVTVRGGAGEGGSDRVTIIWDNAVIRNTWLQMTVEGNDDAGGFNTNTGLATSEIVYWGNKAADSGTPASPNSFATTTTDAAQVFAAIGPGKPITDLRDYDRDGQVTTTDGAIVFANIGSITQIDFDGPPAALALTAQPTVAVSRDLGLSLALAVASRTVPLSAANVTGLHLGEYAAALPTIARPVAVGQIAPDIHNRALQWASDAREPLQGIVDELFDLLARHRQRRT